MNRSRLIASAGALTTAALLLAACGGGSSSSESSAAPAASEAAPAEEAAPASGEPIKIGVIAAQSGPAGIADHKDCWNGTELGRASCRERVSIDV